VVVVVVGTTGTVVVALVGFVDVVGEDDGWLYIVVGAIGLAATMLSPVVWSRSRTTRGARHRGLRRDQVVHER
jgi:hypothetical protein